MGALALWATSDEESRRIFGLSEIFERVLRSDNGVFFGTLVTYIVFGAAVVMLAVNPVSAGQAFTSGLAWSYLLSRAPKLRSRSNDHA